MNSYLITILSTLLCVASLGAFAEEIPHRVAIETAVFDYFHGQGEASSERLRRAFAADHATMVGVVAGDDDSEQLRSWRDMNEVIDNWASNEHPPGGTRDGEILSLEIVDDRIATVLFRSTDRFYDALILANVSGQWKIIAKAFVYQ